MALFRDLYKSNSSIDLASRLQVMAVRDLVLGDSGPDQFLVEAKEVRGIIFIFERHEACVIVAVGGPDPRLALVAQIVNVCPTFEERLSGPVAPARPVDVVFRLCRILPHS